MASIKISELNEYTEVKDDDLFPIVDVANGETKKVKATNIGTGGKELIMVGNESVATNNTKLLIEQDSLNSLGTEVVDSLDGNETDRAPSVMAVNNAIGQIIQSGSNDNGNYIKYSDGTMICRGTVTIPVTTSVWGSLYVCDWTGSISLPSTFINKPTINATSSTNSGAISKVIVTTNAITAISVFRGSEATGVNYPIDYIAIGRWK